MCLSYQVNVKFNLYAFNVLIFNSYLFNLFIFQTKKIVLKTPDPSTPTIKGRANGATRAEAQVSN
jgi:hypothetical protein